MDLRRSIIEINANDGQIVKFSGEGLSDIDFNYVPKITKDQVLKIYSSEIQKLDAEITIDKVFLNKYSGKGGGRRWVWQIYGVRHDKDLGTAAMMFIDSETAEVVFKKMDY